MNQTPNVLVVDDSATVRSVLCGKLMAMRVNAVEAEDGTSAMQLLHASDFDLAIIDLAMPGLDGYDLLGCIRGHQHSIHMPVIVLTSTEDQHAISRALAAGATSFIVKPLNWSAFGAHIEHLMHLSRFYRRHRAELCFDRS